MTHALSLGNSDLRKLRRAGQRYVDKSDLITDVLRCTPNAPTVARKMTPISPHGDTRAPADRRDPADGFGAVHVHLSASQSVTCSVPKPPDSPH